MARAQTAQQLQTIAIRQADIQHNQVNMMLLQQLARGFVTGGVEL